MTPWRNICPNKQNRQYIEKIRARCGLLIGNKYFMEISDSIYYSLLALVVLPVYLFFNLWSWLGWELYKNN
ncbi:hypothetical protein Zmor_023203 [Zophobas morio]|uniref:Uncharacterized protein n=1 Tax=Zophobas morio TaxID=2755281 RepID=A0AA38HXW8_9CUCU|nr:hypothetical protein Zmor_023203 [Zophobas morio]